MKRSFWLSLAFASLLPAPKAADALSVEGFEAAQSIPAGTSLAAGDLVEASALWPEMFAAAKKSIDIEQFYITPKEGEPLGPVLEALRAAGERGVKIRFLAEKIFEKQSKAGFEILKTIPNLELRILRFSEIKADGIIHAKFFVVDDKSAYLGSQNFDWRSLKHIHELGLRITDPHVVKGMAAVFKHDWKAQKKLASGGKVRVLNKKRPQADIGRRAYLVASPFAFNPKGVGDSETELVRLIGTAEKELAIELLDYAPLSRDGSFYPPIDNALRAAAARGVAIRLLVSHWNTGKPNIDHLKSLSLIPNVAIRIVTIPQSREGYIPYARVIHAKYMVLDLKTLWLGTSNWSGGYLDNSRNLEVVVVDRDLAAGFAAIHAKLWISPYISPIDVNKDYPKPKK